LRNAHHTVTYAWTTMSDTSESTQETPDLDAIEAEIAAIELLLERLDARPAWRTRQRAKQPSTWSFTMPTDCMNAYIVVAPTNVQPRRFNSFDSRSDEGVDDGPVLAAREVTMRPDETLTDFAARMHAAEHVLLIEALAAFIDGAFAATSILSERNQP